MERKDKIFFAVYVGVKQIDSYDIAEYIDRVARSVVNPQDDSVEFFFIPRLSTDDTEITCLNPVRVSDEAYQEMEIRVEKYKVAIDKFLKNLKEIPEDLQNSISGPLQNIE